MERGGRKQGEKEARKKRFLNLSFLFVFFCFVGRFLGFFSVSTCTCFQLYLPESNPSFKNSPSHPGAGETVVLLEALPTAVPGPLQMFASCCCRAIQGWQLIQPCSAGLQCSAEGAGNAAVTNGILIM